MLCPIVSKAFGYLFSPRMASQFDVANNAAIGQNNMINTFCKSTDANCSNGTSDNKQNNDMLIADDDTIKKTH